MTTTRTDNVVDDDDGGDGGGGDDDDDDDGEGGDDDGGNDVMVMVTMIDNSLQLLLARRLSTRRYYHIKYQRGLNLRTSAGNSATPASTAASPARWLSPSSDRRGPPAQAPARGSQEGPWTKTDWSPRALPSGGPPRTWSRARPSLSSSFGSTLQRLSAWTWRHRERETPRHQWHSADHPSWRLGTGRLHSHQVPRRICRQIYHQSLWGSEEAKWMCDVWFSS